MRRFSSIAMAVAVVLAVGFAVWHSQAVPGVAAQSEEPAAAAAVLSGSKPASAELKKAAEPESRKVVPPGSTLYVAKRGDSIVSVARQFIERTSYLTTSELEAAIRQANGNLRGTFLKAGEEILIPGILDAPIEAKSIPVPKDFEVRAVYLTGIMAASDHGSKIIRRWREVGGIAVVFDV